MILYAIKTDKDPAVDTWIKETKERSKENSMLKNPFMWKIKKVKKNITVFDVRVLFPNFSWMGWVTGVMVLFVWGATKWLIPCMIVGGLGIFWTGEFFFWMTKKGLKKAGYSGPVKRLKLREVIQEVVL